MYQYQQQLPYDERPQIQQQTQIQQQKQDFRNVHTVCIKGENYIVYNQSLGCTKESFTMRVKCTGYNNFQEMQTDLFKGRTR